MYCWLAGLAACCFCFLFPVPFSFHLISSLISCHVPSGDEMDQYLKVDQWKKKSETESKKNQKEDQKEDQ